jgi:hypothetical protein
MVIMNVCGMNVNDEEKIVLSFCFGGEIKNPSESKTKDEKTT